MTTSFYRRTLAEGDDADSQNTRAAPKEVPIKVLFEKPTIRELAEFLQGETKEKTAPIAPAPSRANYPVSSAQRRMYILNQLEEASTSYNVPAVLLLEGELIRSVWKTRFGP